MIDQNPAPMAAKFELGPDAKVSEISTRVRVNNYTDVHAVAELSDGKLYMVKTYVKASGGCSAPAAKNADEAKGRLGQMRYRQFAKAGEGPTSGAREAQIMIGHPNNSGLQMDQVTQLYIPAFFVNELRLWQDDSLVLAMEGGISISEDPNIRFTYVSNGAKTLPRRGQGHRGPRVPEANGRSTIPGSDAALDADLAHQTSRPGATVSETSHFRFGLRAPEIVERACRLLGRAELPAQISPDLRHAEHGFGRDVARHRARSEATTSIEQEHCSIACRVSPLAFRQPNTYSARADVG